MKLEDVHCWQDLILYLWVNLSWPQVVLMLGFLGLWVVLEAPR